MPDAKRDTVELCYPSNDNGTSVVPGASFGWSAWAQVSASLPDHVILTGLSLFTLINATATPLTGILEIEVGIGAAGSEQPVGRAATAIGYSASGAVETKAIIKGETLELAPVRIAAGTRVAIRATCSSASGGFTLAAKLYGYPAGSYNPIEPLADADTYLNARNVPGGSAVQPALAATTVQTGGSLWVFGGWAQVIAAAPAPLLISGVISGGVTVGGGFDLEIGTGSASNEVTRGLVPVAGRNLTPGPGWGLYRLARPMFVKDGERIAVRARGRPASSNFDLCLQTHELNN